MTLLLPKSEDDGAGGTRFATLEIEQHSVALGPGMPSLLSSLPIRAQSVRFVEVPDGIEEVPPHPSPTRHFAVILSGVYEIQATNGDTYRAGPGEVLFGADIRGGGHSSRILQQPARVMLITLPDDQADPH